MDWPFYPPDGRLTLRSTICKNGEIALSPKFHTLHLAIVVLLPHWPSDLWPLSCLSLDRSVSARHESYELVQSACRAYSTYIHRSLPIIATSPIEHAVQRPDYLGIEALTRPQSSPDLPNPFFGERRAIRVPCRGRFREGREVGSFPSLSGCSMARESPSCVSGRSPHAGPGCQCVVPPGNLTDTSCH